MEAAGAPIMVLDELDSGVGGRLGGAVGALLRRMTLSSGNGKGAAAQVLCVSHLPQVRPEEDPAAGINVWAVSHHSICTALLAGAYLTRAA